MYRNFTDEEKIKAFDTLSELFYDSNFGQLSKSDMELWMFHFYLESVMKNLRLSDGAFDYKACSDYRMSKDLGITQQRVRNLKVKDQLKRPREIDWKKELAALMKNARYDADSRKMGSSCVLVGKKICNSTECNDLSILAPVGKLNPNI